MSTTFQIDTSTSRATPPAATRAAVSRAEDRPPPR